MIKTKCATPPLPGPHFDHQNIVSRTQIEYEIMNIIQIRSSLIRLIFMILENPITSAEFHCVSTC